MKVFAQLVIGLAAFALAAYLAMVVWGVYTALDSATAFYGSEYAAQGQSAQEDAESI